MNQLKDWALLLCAAAVACGLLGILLPRSTSGKAGKMAISFFFLCCLLSPLRTGLGNLSLDLSFLEETEEQLAEELEQEARQLAYSMAQNHILELIQTRLEQQEIIPLALSVDAQETETGILLTARLTLPAKDKDREGEIRILLLQDCGIEKAEFFWQEDEERWKQENGKPSALSG